MHATVWMMVLLVRMLELYFCKYAILPRPFDLMSILRRKNKHCYLPILYAPGVHVSAMLPTS